MVVLVNQSMARRTWKNEDAVGKRITFDGEHFLEIVGVVGDVREFGPREDAPVQLYRPMAQDPFAGNVLVRTAADPELLIPAVRRAVLEANPESAVAKVQTLDEARVGSGGFAAHHGATLRPVRRPGAGDRGGRNRQHAGALGAAAHARNRHPDRTRRRSRRTYFPPSCDRA